MVVAFFYTVPFVYTGATVRDTAFAVNRNRVPGSANERLDRELSFDILVGYVRSNRCSGASLQLHNTTMPRKVRRLDPTKKKRELAERVLEVYRSGDCGNGGLKQACQTLGAMSMYRTLLTAVKQKRSDEQVIKRPGHRTILSNEFEERLVAWVHTRRKGRRCPGRKEVNDQIKQYMEYSDIKPPQDSKTVQATGKWIPGRKFYKRFLRDHPDLSWKKPQIFSKARAIQECEPIVDDYFEKVKWGEQWGNRDGRTMPHHNWYGADETPLRMKAVADKVLSATGEHAAVIAGPNTGIVTLFPVGRAAPHPAVQGDSPTSRRASRCGPHTQERH